MTPAELLAAPAARVLGWTLLHFLWQGAAVALLLGVLLWLTRASSPPLRYLTSCAGLTVMLLFPVITYTVLTSRAKATPEVAYDLAVPTVQSSAIGETGAVGAVGTHRTLAEPSRSEAALHRRLEPFLPYLVAFWCLGVLVLSARLLGGLRLLRTLRTRLHRPVPEVLALKCRDLTQRLGINRMVSLQESLSVNVPLVIGWLRPVILLPTSAISGLSVAQLELILAHELAHVRRNDYLVNLLQSLTETLLFYHPAVWWVSAQIREERENCCDDLAVRACNGDRLGYARALAKLDDTRLCRLAPAATGGSLVRRVRRLAGKATPPESVNPAQWTVGLVLIFVPVFGFSFVNAGQRQPTLLGTYTTDAFTVAELTGQGFAASAACENSGPWTLTFTDNGFFSGNQPADERCAGQNPYVTGSWRLSGRRITFRDVNRSVCGPAEYSYRYALRDGVLSFTPVNDPCRERVYLFTDRPWEKPL